MTADEIAAERERCFDGIKQPGNNYAECVWDGWLRRTLIARAEQAELRAENERLRAESRILNQRYDLLEQENDGLRRNGVVIYVGSEELGQLRAAAAELAEIKRAWGIVEKSS